MVKRILILGAGLSSTSLINYLLDHAVEYDWQVVIGDKEINRAEEKLKGYENVSAIQDLQSRLGVNPDGIIGPQTQTALANFLSIFGSSLCCC